MALFHLGLSTSGHDPALALVGPDGTLLFAEATERPLQDKRAWGIAPDHPSHLDAALHQIGFDRETDKLAVAASWKRAKAELPVQIGHHFLPRSDGLWLRELQASVHGRAGASLLRLGLAQEMPQPQRHDHHLCHAVSAAAFAPVDDATCLVVDGEGEAGAISLYALEGRRLRRRWRSWGPGSLGTFYAWLTQLCGFDWRLGEEWKVMGLASFGTVQPKLVAAFRDLLRVDRGRLLFAEDAALSDAVRQVQALTPPDGATLMDHADLAASGQAAYSAWMAEILDASLAEAACKALILTGGCALNSSCNGRLTERVDVEQLFVPPAPADDGNAVGAALLSWMDAAQTDTVPVFPGMPYLGTSVPQHHLSKLRALGGTMRRLDTKGDSAALLAQRLAKGKIVGVMRGRAEFGPRALGNRSILADPRPKDMKDRINKIVKGREAFRPFAPVLCAEDLGDWFEHPMPSPFMSATLRWRSEVCGKVPAVVHVDGTGRVQSVTADQAPWFHTLIRRFEAETGVPVLLNTSFNIMGKPIVHTVEDAIAVFMTSGIDAMLIEDVLIEKPSPNPDGAG